MIQKHTVHNLSSIHTHQTMTTIAFHRRACLERSRRYSLTIPAKKKKTTKKFSLQRKLRIITLAPLLSINHRLYFVGVMLMTKKIIARMHRKQLHRKTTHSVVITIRIKLWESTLFNCFIHATDRALVGLPLNKLLLNFRVWKEHSANVSVHGSVKL